MGTESKSGVPVRSGVWGERRQGGIPKHRRKLLEMTAVSTFLMVVMILWVSTYTSIKTCGTVQFKHGSLMLCPLSLIKLF